MSCPAIRRAEAKDLTALIKLRHAFFDSQISAGLLEIPTDLEATLAATTPGIITGPRNDVFVLADTTLLAYIYATTRVVPSTRKSLVGSIEEVFVIPTARGGDVGNDLVLHTKDVLLGRGVDRTQLRVLAGNTAGRKFWQRMGFVENVLILELPQGSHE